MKVKFPMIILAGALLMAAALSGGAWAAPADCLGCHAEQVNALNSGLHSTMDCSACHEGALESHIADPANKNLYPKVHFDMESCKSCHPDQYQSYMYDVPGRTYYGGSQTPRPDGTVHVSDWSKTKDLPYWNVLIDGHPFVIETFEERGMKFNQKDAQETRRPMSESCLTCHGTKVAYYMGLKTGPAFTPKFVEINTDFIGPNAINSGNFEFYQRIAPIEVPKGTRVYTYLDATDGHKVKSRAEFPDGRAYTTFTDPTATACGNDPADPAKRTEARNHIWAALEALAFDGLNLNPADPNNNIPSQEAGELCNMCHDPHSGKMRIIQKSLVQAISEKGVMPYDPVKSQIRDFNLGSRQDQIIAVCGQCHVEYVGGYSAIDLEDRHYFPWGKPPEVETYYTDLFNYQQDWLHGLELGNPANPWTLTRPWQTINPNDRGYYPPDTKFGLAHLGNETLIKTQHPEAEVFWNSKMYKGGATCTDCHTTRITRPDGSRYTSHWFASPIKWVDTGYNGQTVNPCLKCHTTMMGTQAKAFIKNYQDNFFAAQEKAQVALVNSLKFIDSIKDDPAQAATRAAAVANHKKAHLRWEYYAQGENSMGFHNTTEAVTEMANAVALATAYVPYPLAPLRLQVTGVAGNSITISWIDQATDETGYIIERQSVQGGPWVEIARPISANPATTGTLTYTDTPVIPGRTYNYRVAAFNANGTSVYTVPAASSSNPMVKPSLAPIISLLLLD